MRHAYLRGQQRLGMSKNEVRKVEEKVKRLNVQPGHYYAELPNNGYAAIKTVSKDNVPVLATFYRRDMGRPRGMLVKLAYVSRINKILNFEQ